MQRTQDWFFAAKCCRTDIAEGREPGAMPRLRRKDGGERCVCWYNGGGNAVFIGTGKRAGDPGRR